MRAGRLVPLVAVAAAAVGFLAGREIWPRQPRLEGRVIRVQVPSLPHLPEPKRAGPGSEAPGPRTEPVFRGTPPTEDLPDDLPRMTVEMKGPEPVARPHGPWSERYPDGSVKTEGEFKEGQAIGLWRSYHENGGLAREARFDDGDLDGEEVLWHPNGVVRMRGTWSKGAKAGKFTYWDEDGNVVREEEWTGGVLSAPVRLWDPKGEFPPEAEALAKASVDGKYRNLLKKVAAPDDRGSYGEFRDWGHWTGTAYMGHTDLQQGFWVYVYPYWYVWGDKGAE